MPHKPEQHIPIEDQIRQIIFDMLSLDDLIGTDYVLCNSHIHDVYIMKSALEEHFNIKVSLELIIENSMTISELIVLVKNMITV